MKSDNPPGLNASDPDADDADDADDAGDAGDAGDADSKRDILASESKIDSKAEKENETAGLAVLGNEKDAEADNAEDAGDADPNTDILAAEKKPAGFSVGNKKDADANRVDPPFIDLLASKSKRDKEKKKASTGLALASAIDLHNHGTKKKKTKGLAIEPHGPGTKEVRSPNRLARRPQELWSRIFGNVSKQVIFLGVVGFCTINALRLPSFSLYSSYFAQSTTSTTKEQTITMSDDRGPLNLHLAFMGDSLTRGQHMSLVYYLHTGVFPTNRPKPNYMEGGFPSHQAFDEYIAMSLNHTEACDCFKPEGSYVTRNRLREIYENRYYRDSQRNNYVTMINKYGKNEAHGHWDPKSIFDYQMHANLSSQNMGPVKSVGPFLWRGNWTDVIRNHLAHLRPKPTYVVINAGIWLHDLEDNMTLPAIRQALDDTGMVGIYRTTTKRRMDTTTHLVPHDVQGCRLLHYCLDVAWTGNITDKAEYTSDDIHFTANVNKKFNEQLLQLLQEVKKKE